MPLPVSSNLFSSCTKPGFGAGQRALSTPTHPPSLYIVSCTAKQKRAGPTGMNDENLLQRQLDEIDVRSLRSVFGQMLQCLLLSWLPQNKVEKRLLGHTHDC